jgi:hypothetical protein
MSDSTITGAGIPLPAESYVTPDGLTIFGAGVAEIGRASCRERVYLCV